MTGSEIRLIREAKANPDRRAYLDRALAEHNDALSRWHRDIRQTGGQPIDLYLLGHQDELVAGLYGEVFWESCEVDRLWVAPEHRHRGLGSQLLLAAESLAREQNCRFIHLTTFSFQAPEFYQRHGFEICGTLPDFPPGHSKHWLRKLL